MDALIIPLVIILGLSNHSSAANHALQAYAKQSGIERMVDEYQQRKFNETLRARVGQAAWLTKSVVEQRITVEWRF